MFSAWARRALNEASAAEKARSDEREQQRINRDKIKAQMRPQKNVRCMHGLDLSKAHCPRCSP
jgi:hypothetical protein